jgi:hypothetical protein
MNRLYTVSDKKVKPYSLIERAYFGRESSESVWKILDSAAITANDEIARAHAGRIGKCSLKTNHYLATNLFDKNGECFDGYGSFWGCNSKFCQPCQKRAASGNQKSARQAIENTRMRKHVKHFCWAKNKQITERERLRTIVLTMPKIKAACLLSLEILQRAWSLLRKRDLWRDYVTACVKSHEFTVRVDDSYHAHSHLIVGGFFIPEHLLKAEWKYCVEKAFIEFGFDYAVLTEHLVDSDKLNVQIKLVHSLDKALKEVCKYMTKNESWSQIPAVHLLELANVKRFPRMFDMGGRFRDTAKRFNKRAALIKARRKAKADEAKCDQYYVQTNGIIDGEQKQIIQPTRKRKKNWRDRVGFLGSEVYLLLLDKEISKTVEVRKAFLAKKYPLSSFSDQTDFVWHTADIEFVEELSKERVKDWENSPEYKYFWLFHNPCPTQAGVAVC